MTTYTVTAERSGKWWVLQADELPGAITQVARLDQADQIKEAIAFVGKLPESEVEIRLRPVVSEAVTRRLEQVRELRARADAAKAAAALEWSQVAKVLSSEGFTMRDVGTILGISHQRAQQLIKS